MHHYSVAKTTTEKMNVDIESGVEDGWELYQATHVGGRDWVLIFHDFVRDDYDDEPDSGETEVAGDAEIKRLRYRLGRVETAIDSFADFDNPLDSRVYELVCAALGRPEGKYWKTKR